MGRLNVGKHSEEDFCVKMMKKECFTTEWIEQVSSELHSNKKNLIEKVIHALSLFETLVKAGCPLAFK